MLNEYSTSVSLEQAEHVVDSDRGVHVQSIRDHATADAWFDV